MNNTFGNSEKFFKAAMLDISNKLLSKMKALGIDGEDAIQHEINMDRLARVEMTTDNIISWRYDYQNINVLEAIWTPDSLTYKEQKDERTIKRNV